MPTERVDRLTLSYGRVSPRIATIVRIWTTADSAVVSARQGTPRVPLNPTNVPLMLAGISGSVTTHTGGGALFSFFRT